MITLEEKLFQLSKIETYNYYKRIVKNKKEFNSVSKASMYKEITSYYQENPEIILELCDSEELSILKYLISDNIKKKHLGYIEYLTLNNLKENFYVFESNNEYYIPRDMLNYIKMAINILDVNEHTFLDIELSIAVGLSRIYNVLTFKEYKEIYEHFCLPKTEQELKKIIKTNWRVKKFVKLIKYKNENYVVSSEFDFYKDVLEIKSRGIQKKLNYTLEEVICVGKYYINILNRPIFNFLNFLENHLEAEYIDTIIHNLILYAGFDINNDETLKNIASNIEELYIEIKKVIPYFPTWVFNGNSINDLEMRKQNTIIDKNAKCPCGSGKKYKHCCGK